CSHCLDPPAAGVASSAARQRPRRRTAECSEAIRSRLWGTIPESHHTNRISARPLISGSKFYDLPRCKTVFSLYGTHFSSDRVDIVWPHHQLNLFLKNGTGHPNAERGKEGTLVVIGTQVAGAGRRGPRPRGHGYFARGPLGPARTRFQLHCLCGWSGRVEGV